MGISDEQCCLVISCLKKWASVFSHWEHLCYWEHKFVRFCKRVVSRLNLLSQLMQLAAAMRAGELYGTQYKITSAPF